MTKRAWILLALLAAAGVVALTSGGGGDAPAVATAPQPRAGGRSAAAGQAGGPAETGEILALKSLDVGEVAGEYEPGRDPFRFYEPPPPPPAPPPRPQPPPPSQPVAPQPPPGPTVPPKPQPPPIDVQYLGSFGPEAAPIAVFTDPDGEEIWNVRLGEAIEGKFRVVRIGYESVDLGYVGFPDEPPARLPVGGAGR